MYSESSTRGEHRNPCSRVARLGVHDVKSNTLGSDSSGSSGQAVAENFRGVDYNCRSEPPTPVNELSPMSTALSEGVSSSCLWQIVDGRAINSGYSKLEFII